MQDHPSSFERDRAPQSTYSSMIRLAREIACDPPLPESFRNALDKPRVFHYKLSLLYVTGLLIMMIVFLAVHLLANMKIKEYYLTRTGVHFVIFVIILIAMRKVDSMNRMYFLAIDFVIIGMWAYQSYAYMSLEDQPVFERPQPVTYVLNYAAITICYIVMIYHSILRLAIVLTVITYTCLNSFQNEDTMYYTVEMMGRLILLLAMFFYYSQYYYRAFEGAGHAFEEKQALCQIYDQLAEGVFIFESDESCRYQNKMAERMLGCRVNTFSTFISELKKRTQRAEKRKGTLNTADAQLFSTLADLDEKARTSFTLNQIHKEFLELHSIGKVPRLLETDVISTFDLELIEESSISGVRFVEAKTQVFPNGVKWRFVLVLSDISQTKEIVKMKEIEEYKDILLASVTHELRTPLNCMIPLLVEAISQSKLDIGIRQEYLDPVLSNAKLLLSLINDILDFCKMRRQTLRLVLSHFNLDEMLQDLTRLFEIQFRSRKISFQINRDSSVPARIYGEKDRTRQILINLIGNAIKFTRRGGVTVEVTKVDQDKIRYSVIDTGIGISAEDQKKLFIAFGQIEAEEYLRLNNHGTGLGLMISNNIARLLGAERICISSNYGSGSCFFFDVSSRKRENSDEANISISDDPPKNYISILCPHPFNRQPATIELPIKNKDSINWKPVSPCVCRRVLVADDNDYNRLALTKALKRQKLFPIEACDGQEAYEQVIDLMREEESCGAINCRRLMMIISDLNMPRMNGNEFHEKVRQLDVLIPFILASSFDADEVKKVSTQSHLDFIISKPISDEQITNLIKEIRNLV